MGWIEDFVVEFGRHFDTPDQLLEAVGYFSAGAALSNRVYLKSPDEVTTNSYIILCSPPGWYHKSAPIRTAVRMLKGIISDKEILPSNPSAEALGKVISYTCKNDIGHGIMIYDEFRSFLSHVRKEYAAPIASLVTEKIERGVQVQFSRKKENGVEVDKIPEGFVLSFIASTTTPWLLESMKESEISGGMMSRFLLIEAHEKTRSYELPPPIDEVALDKLGSDLDRIRSTHSRTEFRFSGDAARLYSKIYRDIEKKAHSHGSPEYPSIISRTPLYVKKLSLIRAALEDRGDSLIHEEDVLSASTVVWNSIESYERIVDEAAASDGAYGKLLIRVRKIIKSMGEVSNRDLLRLTHVKVKELEDVIECLVAQGLVERMVRDGNVFVRWSS